MRPPERDALIADICALLEAARRAGDRARHPPSSWRASIAALGYEADPNTDPYAYARAVRGLAAATWRAGSRDYVNYLVTLTSPLRRSALSGLPDEKLWEILVLLAER